METIEHGGDVVKYRDVAGPAPWPDRIGRMCEDDERLVRVASVEVNFDVQLSVTTPAEITLVANDWVLAKRDFEPRLPKSSDHLLKLSHANGSNVNLAHGTSLHRACRHHSIR